MLRFREKQNQSYQEHNDILTEGDAGAKYSSRREIAHTGLRSKVEDLRRAMIAIAALTARAVAGSPLGMSSRLRFLRLIPFLALFAAIPANSTAEDAPAAPEAVTIAEPGIPVDELELLLTPLTKEQLLVEASAWQKRLQAKAAEIAQAEIAVKRENVEIRKAQEIQRKAEDAKAKLEEVKKMAALTKASGDPEKLEEMEETAREAEAAIREVSETVEEAVAAAERTDAAQDDISDEVKADLKASEEVAHKAEEALHKVEATIEDAKDKTGLELERAAEEVGLAATVAEEMTDEVVEDAQHSAEVAEESLQKSAAIETTSELMHQAELAKREEKVGLLEKVTELREERTVLIDHLNAVLVSLHRKTAPDDTETLAKISEYEAYIHAISGIHLDVEDTTSAWIAIKGWTLSEQGGVRLAKNLAKFFGILLAAWFLSKILGAIVRRTLHAVGKASKLLEDFLSGAVRWVVMAIGIVMALAAMEVSVGPLLAIVGAAGFVIAFALQDSLSNFASGLMILAFKPYDMGHVVEAGGVSGTVTSMNLVSTTIKTFDNKLMVVPNNKIWHEVITNASSVPTRRIDLEFGIGYDDDIEKAQEVLTELVETHPLILKDPEPTIKLHSLGDSSVNIICRPWARTSDYWAVYWDIMKSVKHRFDEEGIGIPYPQQDVRVFLQEGNDGKEKATRFLQKSEQDTGKVLQPLETATESLDG